MKVSLNWVRFINQKYGCAADPAPQGIDKLVEKIGAQLGAVEEVIDLGKKYEGIVVVKVVSCQKHPNADKLTVCWVDDGGAVKKVKRNKDGLIEIVCGAPNVKAGMLAAWIPPGKTVPSTFDKEPLVLEAREIRGVVSSGMLASAKELALGDDHTGIVEVDEPLKPGASFVVAYDLDDYVIDIENKMFTHRPDCFGMLGIARELAGIQNHMFKSPNWYRAEANIPKGNARETHKLAVKNDLPRLVPRFCAVVMKDVRVMDSPLWLKVRLSSVGIKSINNIVDITNFLMFETAQPLHAYDYDKVLAVQKNRKNGVKLGARLSKKGEELKLLGDKQLKLEDGAVLITADGRPIGLGGVMGGAETEVDVNTKNIIIECACFDMNITRQTAMHYGLFTDAATRFTKNQSPLQNSAVLAKAVDDVTRLAGGRLSGPMIDDNHLKPAVLKQANIHSPVSLSRDFINLRLGLNLSTSQIAKILTNVEFRVSTRAENLTISAPFWRTDVEIPEDIVEEIGRLYGYDHLPMELPSRDLTPATLEPLLVFKSKIRDILVRAGGNEALTYSFVHGSLLEKAGQDPAQSYHVRNAISPDLQFYRQSLVPSLLEKVHLNIKNGYDEFTLFEIGKIHIKDLLDKEKLPVEFENLALVITSKMPKAGAPYFAAKKQLEYLLKEVGIEGVEYSQSQARSEAYDPNRSTWVNVGKTLIGVVGEPSARLRSSLKLPAYTAQFELNVSALMSVAKPVVYQPLNRFPSLDQDLCLRSSTDLSYAELTAFMERQLNFAAKEHGYEFSIWPIDIFQRRGDKSHKQTTWRIRLWHPERTLITEEVNKLLDKIAVKASKELRAERI